MIDQKYFVRGLCSNSGGMGTVLFVHHVQRADALLVLKYCKHGDEEMLRRFQREVRVMQSFAGNDAVAQIVDANLAHMPPYFVMPYFENGDVSRHAEFIRARADTTELYFMRMIDCIEQLHMRNIFHRDIKPQNFLLGGGNLVVSDLGLCTQLDSSTMFTRQSVWAGTPGYIPPEFLDNGGFRNADARGDVFMLGATFRNILAADGAFIPHPAIQAILARATAPDKSRRYASLADLRQSLKSAFDVILNRQQGQAGALELKQRIVDRWTGSHLADPAEIGTFIQALIVVPAAERETICLDLKLEIFEALAASTLEPGLLSQFLDCYREMAEHSSYGWSFAEVIADNCKLLFSSMFVGEEDKAEALRIAVIAAERQNRFAAMDTCRDMIVSVGAGDFGLAQRVHDLMMEYDHYFMQNIDPGQCKAMAVRQGVVQLKKRAEAQAAAAQLNNPFAFGQGQ
ncbi:protein kinase domain-containing protein [Cupriavidus necator]|uniref:protein kinase domain-containing protein n=1 Tax=Cupriavidus necator TaxID=106590 RepID=UPI0018AF866A|nr:protein kinase [Cupriavidus necator]